MVKKMIALGVHNDSYSSEHEVNPGNVVMREV